MTLNDVLIGPEAIPYSYPHVALICTRNLSLSVVFFSFQHECVLVFVCVTGTACSRKVFVALNFCLRSAKVFRGQDRKQRKII